MPDAPIPDEVRHFLLEKIDSIAQLEALILLRNFPNEDWDVVAVARRLYIGEPVAETVLQKLCADRMLSLNSSRYRYEPKDNNQREIIDRLCDAYARFLVPVTNIIHEKRPRIQEFADAFKFRKDGQ